MKKTYKLIGVGLLIIIAVAIVKNRPKEDLRATADLKEEFSKITFETDVTPKAVDKTIDFSTCGEEDGFTIETQTGKNSIDILGVENDYCVVETNYESGAGNFTNNCEVPLSAGEIKFSSFGFEPISQYCSVKNKDGAIYN